MGSSSQNRRSRREHDFVLDFVNLPLDAKLDVLETTASADVADVLLGASNFIVAFNDTRGLNRMLRRLSEYTRHEYPFLIGESP